jgi:hypothetical protein
MSFEMLDGFFTALVIGPERVPRSEYLPVIWGTDDGGGPIWDSAECAEAKLFKLLPNEERPVAGHTWRACVARSSDCVLISSLTQGT